MSKYFLVLITSILMATTLANAQQEIPEKKRAKHEVALGYGTWSSIQLLEGVHSGIDGYSETPVEKKTGTISIAYRYHITNWLFAGIGMGYEQESGAWNTQLAWESVTTQGRYKRAVFSFAPEIGFSYSHDKPVTTYGYIGVGNSYLNEIDAYSLEYYNDHYINGINDLGGDLEKTNNRYKWSMQICPIGVSFGGTHIRGFMELGWGYKGIFNIGTMAKI